MVRVRGKSRVRVRVRVGVRVRFRVRKVGSLGSWGLGFFGVGLGVGCRLEFGNGL